MSIPVPATQPLFQVDENVIHLKKGGLYCVERIPGQLLIQVEDQWLPGYRYRRIDATDVDKNEADKNNDGTEKNDGKESTIEEFVRTQEDFERSFARAR